MHAQPIVRRACLGRVHCWNRPRLSRRPWFRRLGKMAMPTLADPRSASPSRKTVLEALVEPAAISATSRGCALSYQHRELVAAKAGQHVAGTQLAFHPATVSCR